MAIWNEIPNRWENYTTCGYPIPKTPFVAFKVPLSEELQNRYDEMYPSFLTEAAQEKHKWTLKDLEETLPRLDLIIDLTATERYYNPNNLSGHIMHDKIKTEGHVVPHKHVIKRFFWAVDEMISRKKDALIGVHCTHGVNRSGYLICRYLIEKRNWEPSKAIAEFNLHRGHQMERQNYIDDLESLKKSLHFTVKEQSEIPDSNPENLEFENDKENGFENKENRHSMPRKNKTSLVEDTDGIEIRKKRKKI